MKKVVITGGTGFVGANLARAMVASGYETHLFVREGHKEWRLRGIHDHFERHHVELDDREALLRLLQRVRPDWIFHLAAYGAYESQDDAFVAARTNVDGTMALLLAAADVGFEGFVHAGSSSEYGAKDHPPVEDEGLSPNSYYAVTKAAGTMFCSYVGAARDLNVSTLRLYSVYGPYEEPTRLVPALIRHGLRRSLPVMTSPETARDFVYVGDVVAAFERAARAPRPLRGRVYNVGTGRQQTLNEVVAVARDVLGISVEPQWGTMAARKWDTAVWVSDPNRARAELGWEAATSFEEGFRKTVEWLRADPEMLAFYAGQHELPE